jgi:uroporphyrinogen-III synthase
MRVLVTRPLPDAERTADRLRALGHEPVVAPLLTIVVAPPPDELPAPAAIVLTSANGARALSSWPQSVDWRHLPVFATGRATADTARLAGFTDVRSGEGDAADLAALVMAQIGADAGPILYPAARDRSGGLNDRLKRGGYDVRMIEAYRAEMAETLEPELRHALASSSIDAALFYSRRTATGFCRLVTRAGIGDLLSHVTLLVLSERVAEPLRTLGATVRVAESPDEASLFRLLARGCG